MEDQKQTSKTNKKTIVVDKTKNESYYYHSEQLLIRF